jgi:TonB family protein
MNRLLLLVWLVPTAAEAPLAVRELDEPDDDVIEPSQNPGWVLHRAVEPKGRGGGRGACGCGEGWLGGRAWKSGWTVREGWADSFTDRLKADDVRRVIRENRHVIRYCYETARTEHPDLAGRVALRFVISESGAVTEADVTESSGVQALDDCVRGRVALMPFPSPGPRAMVRVSYPFVFTPAPD